MMDILGITIWQILKIFITIFLGIYMVFAIVVIRQIGLMIKTVQTGFEFQLRVLGFAHFLFAVGVFIFALLIL